jgi:hypothetical protein
MVSRFALAAGVEEGLMPTQTRIDYPALVERLRDLGDTEAAAALERLLSVNEHLHDLIKGYQKRLKDDAEGIHEDA